MGYSNFYYKFLALKVSQALMLPVFRPVSNQRWRWALVPWVKLSGTTAPPLERCNASSPILAAAFMADSMSPPPRIWREFVGCLANTPEKH